MATSGDSQKAPTRTAKEEVEAQSEYEAYKSRCEQKPNEGFSKCFAALTNQKRWEDCADQLPMLNVTVGLQANEKFLF